MSLLLMERHQATMRQLTFLSALRTLGKQQTNCGKKCSQDFSSSCEKSQPPASALKNAIGDEFLGLRLKCRALLIWIWQRVQQSLLAAVPFKRKMSRAKKGVCLFP